jgi:hypothetical protein
MEETDGMAGKLDIKAIPDRPHLLAGGNDRIPGFSGQMLAKS